jgi:dihydrofolate reductase
MIQGLAGEGAGTTDGLLFGRKTYEDLYRVWARAKDNPFTDILNNTQKYVVSRGLREPLPWQNSTLLSGEAVQTVGELRAGEGKGLVVLGSGDLLRSLLPHGVVDRLILLIHPLVLGSGQRLLDEGTAFADLRLLDSRTSTTGVIIATYDVTAARPA